LPIQHSAASASATGPSPGASSASPDAATSSHAAGNMTGRCGASGSAAANARRIRTPRQVAIIFRWVFMGGC
jgi:hypothetical protein